jgi:hypothetical protein
MEKHLCIGKRSPALQVIVVAGVTMSAVGA